MNQGKISRTLLRRLLGTNLDADLRSAAENALSHLGEPNTPASARDGVTTHILAASLAIAAMLVQAAGTAYHARRPWILPATPVEPQQLA